MKGHCQCRNILIDWKIRDFSLLAKSCQCSICAPKSASWLSKTGSSFTLTIQHRDFYKEFEDSKHNAYLHQCQHCGDLVAMTSIINRQRFGALNRQNLTQCERFPIPKETKFYPSNDTQVQEQNWSSPVCIKHAKMSLEIIK